MPDLKTVGAIALAAVPVGLLLAGLTSAYLAARNERRRTQPVVIHHEWRKRGFSDRRNDAWSAAGYLTNEGGGPAFNVRCGIDMQGYRFPYRGGDIDGLPHRWRVVRVGQRLPEEPPVGDGMSSRGIYAFTILLPLAPVAGLQGDPDVGRVYWCRYENAFGQTWETRNPADPTVGLTIHHLRGRRRHDRRDAQRLRRLQTKGAVVEKQALQELIDAREAARDPDAYD